MRVHLDSKKNYLKLLISFFISTAPLWLDIQEFRDFVEITKRHIKK